MEIRSYLRTVRVNMKCDVCQNGVMLPDHENGVMMVLTSFPPKYTHFCNKCGAKGDYHEIYPKIEYEEIAEHGRHII